MLGRLLTFYGADHCVLLLDLTSAAQLYRASEPAAPVPLTPGAEDETRMFLVQESNSCPAVFIRPGSPGIHDPTYKCYDPQSNKVLNLDPAAAAVLAELLDAHSLIVVTCQYREHLRGSFLVSSRHANAFDIGDAVFLLQVANQVLPLIENIRLVDRLASDASEAERQRIARSVHDRVIQPYYGLQIGLKALQGLLESEEQSRTSDSEKFPGSGKPEQLLEQLMIMTSEGINELREYVTA